MISHILVPLDGSELGEAVLPYAKDLGRRLNAKVRFLQVSEGEMPDLWDARSDARAAVEAAAKLTEREEKVADNYLSDLVSSWRAEGIDAECTVVEGAPAVKIIETAHSLDVDLIAMSTHGRSGLGRLVSGSVADEVLREAGIPVLLVKPIHTASQTIEATASASVAGAGAMSLTS